MDEYQITGPAFQPYTGQESQETELPLQLGINTATYRKPFEEQPCQLEIKHKTIETYTR